MDMDMDMDMENMESMEVDLFNNNTTTATATAAADAEADADQLENQIDHYDHQGERCGICMDLVLDRGLLDSCQHWFCFVCIDNWATITNLCPLCQNEFQLITCIPVFDSIATNKPDDVDDDSDRDDDWCIEDKNNTLAFPSYYIDENAVTCLDGGGCKIRSGSLAPEELLAQDTSVACDSCDIWYHAFCVGFDPEGSEVDTWLCPRCLVNGAEKKSESKEMFDTEGQLSLSIGDHHSLVHTCSGKVSISIADDGETALVISKIEDVAKESVSNCVSTQEVAHSCGIEQSMLSLDSSSELYKPLDQESKAIQPQPTIVSVKREGYDVECGPNEEGSSISPDLKLSLASTSSNKSLIHASEGNPSANENLADRKTNLAAKTVKKRKCAGYSVQMNHEDGRPDVEPLIESSTRKSKARKGNRRILNDQADVRTLGTVDKIVKDSKGSVDGKAQIKKSPTVDIMNIVKGAKSIADGSMNQKEAGKNAKLQKNAARLRVKKIMRRPNDNEESAEVVQKLKKEIREAVSKKSSDTGKCIVDPELLAAFRAAVAEPAQKPTPVNVKAKKLMFQKGKAREHLTKKIYAMSNGKRKRAWDRDCEVEFWKHRCLRTSKPEKIATLKSVLNLLQRNPETRLAEQNSKEDDRAPILSRLYLADASVFPRKDDIKPLSVLKASTSSHKNGMLTSVENDAKSCVDNCTVQFSNMNEISAQSNAGADDKNKESTCNNNGVPVRKLNTGGQSEKCSALKKITVKSEGVPIDKRKWALEILARKTASNNTNPTQQKQDDAVSKGNYPLLAELPTDMRPKLAPIRHNKIPSSVRQAQLYRLAEHFLKMANLPSICRTAATELAVADAVNIEKQVADRTTSKVVYLNLCSQEIRRHANACTPAGCAPSSPSAAIPTETEQSSKSCLGSETQAALRAAGLLSDSPPSSPLLKDKDLNGSDSPIADVKEEESENIFEMDSHPDLDIYGDFEYDLDEEDYIGATSIASSKPQAEEGGSKVKVVFSTLTLSKSENASDGKEHDLPSSTNLLLRCLNDADSESSHMEGKKDSVPVLGGTLLDGGGELSLVECEELYGPEKEPVIRELPIVVSADNSTSPSASNLDIKNIDTSHRSVMIEGQSPSSSHAVDNTLEEKNSDLKDDEEPVDNTQKEKNSDLKVDKKTPRDSVLKKVEAYIKEHVRPLCKSGVITVDQYRWAVGKTTDKVMKYHTKAKNANFLIKDGDKVKKLAEQYIEAAKHKENK